MKKFLLYSYFFLLLPYHAWATDYYVNLDAVSNGDGSVGSPWDNIDDSRVSQGPVSAGDTVYIWGSGSDKIVFTASDTGTSGSPVTYKLRPGYSVDLNGGGSGTFAYINHNCNYLTFDGLTVHNYDRMFRITATTYGTSSTGIIIQNCILYDSYDFSAIGTGYGAADDLTIDNCTIHDCGDGSGDHCIYLAEGDGITIKDSTVYNCARNCIQWNTRYNDSPSRAITNGTIEGNYIYYAGKGGAGAYGGYGDGNGLMLMDNGSSPDGIQTTVLKNNVIFQNMQGINFRDQTASTNYIVNNTIWDNDDVGMEWSGSPAANYINNISCDNGTNVSGSSSGTVSNNLTADPGFVSETPGNADFMKLDSGASTAIDQGNDQSARVSYDYWDTSRPQNSVFDIGAHEYGGDVTPPTVDSAAVNGTTVTITFDEAVVTSGYDAGDFDIDCTTAGQNISLSNPTGAGTIWAFTAASAVGNGDTCNLDYTGSTDDIEDTEGNDLATFSDTSVTNNTPASSNYSGLKATGLILQ